MVDVLELWRSELSDMRRWQEMAGRCGGTVPWRVQCVLSLADALEASRAECEALRAALRDCLEAMQAWGTEEDGIPDWSPLPAPANPWGAWQRACAALGEDGAQTGGLEAARGCCPVPPDTEPPEATIRRLRDGWLGDSMGELVEEEGGDE